jgi:hypothetical protein
MPSMSKYKRRRVASQIDSITPNVCMCVCMHV